MPTSHASFLERIPRDLVDTLSERTIDLWFRIYRHIEEHGAADVADDEVFLRAIRHPKYISDATISKHLRRMGRANLIQGHVMVLRSAGRNVLHSSFPLSFGRLPTRFIRYTLPGRAAPLHLARAQAADEEFHRIMRDPNLHQQLECETGLPIGKWISDLTKTEGVQSDTPPNV